MNTPIYIWRIRGRSLLLVALALATVLAVWLLALVGTQPRQAAAVDAPHYAVTDLGTGEVYAINNSGQAVGSKLFSTGGHAVLYDNGTVTDLGTLQGATNSEAYGINDNAQIVGESSNRAFLYENGTMSNLGALSDVGGSSARDINGTGQIVGESGNRAFLYENGTMKDLNALMGSSLSKASDINDSGQIVGKAQLSGSGNTHAFIYKDGSVTDLGTLAGDTYSEGNAINGLGQVVGISADTLRVRVFLYSGGVMTNLQNAIPANSGWTLTNASDINDSGMIVATGIDSTFTQHVLLLTPTNYNFSGFFQPVDNPPTFNTVKAGSAIPVKFSLGGDKGLEIFNAGYPKSSAISCDTQAPTDAIEQTVSTADAGHLSYDASSDQYTYVWKTDKSWTGCKQLDLGLNDKSPHVANFKFSK